MAVLFPLGLDGPTLRGIPSKLRVEPEMCRVGPSCIEGEEGLFATCNLPVGMTWLMGGDPFFGSRTAISWPEHGFDIEPAPGVLGGALPFEIFGWKANEPPDGKIPNAVFLSSPEGLYLTLYREVNAMQEIFVYYGHDYPRDGYEVTRYDDDDGDSNWDLDREKQLDAVKALKSVYGVQDRNYYREK